MNRSSLEDGGYCAAYSEPVTDERAITNGSGEQ
jgi:hypothetical protein